MELGTASAAPGEYSTGYLDVTDLPTGTSERVPVTIARGETDGPTLWVTGGVHGNEVTGIAATQDVLAESVPDGLSGTVVCAPMCNPAGIRRLERTSYYHDDDPNRYFPTEDGGPGEPRVQERIDERLYEAITDTADALLDLHTAQAGSIPFVIRDRVLFDGSESADGTASSDDTGSSDDTNSSDEGESTDATESSGGGDASESGREESIRRDEETARDLAARLADLAEATGLPVVTEYPVDEYEERNLHRSTAGAVLDGASIPALTLELGSFDVVEEDNRAVGVAAVYRVMVELGLLDAVPETIANAAPSLEAPVDYPVRRYVGPHCSTAGFCRHRVRAGDVFRTGDVVAEVVDPHGEVRERLESDRDGYVLGRRSPVVYENDPVVSAAVRDEGDLVARRD